MNPIPPPNHEHRYRALGLIKGRLQPVPGSYAQGHLITEDEVEYPATPGRFQLMKRFSHCLETDLPYWFYVQPQPRPGGVLGLGVIKILSLPESELPEDLPEEEFDLFSPAPENVEEGFHLRGDVEAGDGVLTVTVRRKPQGSKQFPPLTVPMQGFLPGVRDGDFWDLQAEREGHELLLVDGSSVLSRPDPELEE